MKACLHSIESTLALPQLSKTWLFHFSLKILFEIGVQKRSTVQLGGLSDCFYGAIGAVLHVWEAKVWRRGTFAIHESCVMNINSHIRIEQESVEQINRSTYSYRSQCFVIFKSPTCSRLTGLFREYARCHIAHRTSCDKITRTLQVSQIRRRSSRLF